MRVHIINDIPFELRVGGNLFALHQIPPVGGGRGAESTACVHIINDILFEFENECDEAYNFTSVVSDLDAKYEMYRYW